MYFTQVRYKLTSIVGRLKTYFRKADIDKGNISSLLLLTLLTVHNFFFKDRCTSINILSISNYPLSLTTKAFCSISFTAHFNCSNEHAYV